MGKYVSSFNSIQEAVEAMGLKSPHVAYVNGASNTDGLVYVNVGDDEDVFFEDNGGEISGYTLSMVPFHFIALENSTISFGTYVNGNYNIGKAPKIYYSYDNKTWNNWKNNSYSRLSLNTGEKLYFRGNNPNGFSKDLNEYSKFSISGSVNVAGNFNSLVNTDLSSEITIGKYCFQKLFYQQNAIKNIKAYVTILCDESFYECSALTSFEAPNLTYIGTYAFIRNTNLTSFVAKKLNYIVTSAFYQCSSLASFEAPNLTYVGDNAFGSCTSLTSFDAPNLTYIGSTAFSNCISLTSFDAPNLICIGNSALKNSPIYGTLPVIDDLKWYNNDKKVLITALTSFSEFENSDVVSISGKAFEMSKKILRSVNTPKLEIIATKAFYDCTSLSSFEAPNLTYVGDSAFYQCSSLASFEAPSLTYISGGAFQNCSSLTSFDAPNLTYIGGHAFYDCTSLSSFEAPNLTYLNSQAFDSCYSLSYFEASNITYIDDFAFDNVAQSTADGCDFYFNNETPAQIGSSTFYSAKINHIYVPASAVDTYKTATNWTYYAQYITAIP